MCINMISISVIIPIYNRQNCIENTILSTLKQTLKNIEIICVDDGSTDGTMTVLQRLAKSDNRVRVFHKENGGAASARNVGIREAKGEYLFFLDSDDRICSYDVLQRLYYCAKQNSAQVCGGKLLIENDSGVFVEECTCLDSEGFLEFADYQSCYYFSRFIYKRKLLTENNIFFPNISDYEDPVFFVNVMVTEGKFFYVDIDVYLYNHYHQETTRISQKVFLDRIRGITEILHISCKKNYEKLHYKMYMALVDCVENNGYDFLPNDELEIFVVLIKANEAIDMNILEKTGKPHSNRDVLPILNFIWTNSNKYQMLKNRKLFCFIKSKKK